MPVDAQAVGDVVEDRFRERVRLLEHHADPPPEVDDVDRRRVDVLAVDADRPSTRVPGTMSFIRLSERRNVDLPQPDGPMSAVTWFGMDLRLMSFEDAVRAVVEIQPATSILSGRRSSPDGVEGGGALSGGSARLRASGASR